MASGREGSGALAERYATALFDLAEDEDCLDAIAADLARLKELSAENEDLRRLLRTPVVSAADKARAMGAVLDRIGAHALTHRFLGVVIANRRLFALSAMGDAYRKRLADFRGEVTAEVVSARALSDSQRERIGDTLRRALGRRVAVEARVDPELIGGLVVRIGSRMIDASVASKLRRLRLAMKGVE